MGRLSRKEGRVTPVTLSFVLHLEAVLCGHRTLGYGVQSLRLLFLMLSFCWWWGWGTREFWGMQHPMSSLASS